MTFRRRQRGDLNRARVIPALFFALVWLVGYEVVPTLHQAMHARIGAHTHGVAAHCHGGFCHSDQDRTERPAHRSSDRRHGDGSLEHRGVAALGHDITIHVPELVLVGELPPDAVLETRIASFERCAPPARGPPV